MSVLIAWRKPGSCATGECDRYTSALASMPRASLGSHTIKGLEPAANLPKPKAAATDHTAPAGSFSTCNRSYPGVGSLLVKAADGSSVEINIEYGAFCLQRFARHACCPGFPSPSRRNSTVRPLFATVAVAVSKKLSTTESHSSEPEDPSQGHDPPPHPLKQSEITTGLDALRK